MYVEKESVKEKNFLASAKFQKIVQAGTVYKKAGKAIGLIFADVDVTHGPQPAAVMVEGYVIEARLPAEVSLEDKATMTGIKFR